MKTQSVLLAALASAPAALAHTVFTDFYVDGQPQGDGVAMRMSPYSDTAGSPIASLDSDDMACNVGGTEGVSRVQSVKDGALLSFEIRSWADDPSKEPLDRGHKGPCAVYLKKVDSAINDRGAGDGWFKIFDHGYDASTKRWCSDEIIDNKGLLNVRLPRNLEGGSYLARPEILALHAANSGDPQFYTGCAQIFLESSGNLGPVETVSIPGYVKYGQPATSFDIYNTDNAKYTLPGPPVAQLTARTATGDTAKTSQTEGLKPEGCILENANWCGKEVPDYSDEKGCWAAGENCWAQSKVCYDTSPPTGNAGCELWSKKCTALNDACNAKNFNGPPNKGKVLTPEKNSIDVGLIMSANGGGVVEGNAPSAPKTSQKVEDNKPAQQTPAPNAGNDNKPENKPAPAQSPAKSPEQQKPAATPAAPKPSPAGDGYPVQQPKPVNNENKPVNNENKPAYTITVAPSVPGSAATPAADDCPKGWKCVTVTEVETVYQTVTVTAAYDSYKRAADNFRHRRRMAHH